MTSNNETQSDLQPTRPVLPPNQARGQQAIICHVDAEDERECPTCGLEMRLWASFYRCKNCGYKESCCF